MSIAVLQPLAQASPSPSPILDGVAKTVVRESLKNAQEAANQVNRLWEVLLRPGGSTISVYGLLTQLGLCLAVGTLLLFMVQWGRQLMEGEIEKPFQDLIWPLIVVLLLANQGRNLASLTFAMRDLINFVNYTGLVVLDQTMQIDQITAGVSSYRLLRQRMDDVVSQCKESPQQRQNLAACYDRAMEQLAQLKAEHDQQQQEAVLRQRADQELADLTRQLETAKQENTSIVPLARDAGLNKIEATMLSLGQAFQRTIDACLLLTALIGPIAVGTSLLPWGSRPILAWIAALAALALAKWSYNLLNAVVIVTVYYIGVEGNLLYQDIATGALNPLVAFGLATGGGKSLYDGMLSANPQLRIANYGTHYNVVNAVQNPHSPK